MGWALGILAGVIVLDLLLRLPFIRVVIPVFEQMPPFGVKPAEPDEEAERVEFPTTNDLTLRGSLYRHTEEPSRGLIIFCPELGGNHWMALRYCRGLWDAGFDILAFDFRNQGDSDALSGYEPLHWLTEFEVSDAVAAIRYARERSELQTLPLGLFGVSRGGGAALAAAARCRDVRCVACDSAFSTDAMMAHYARRWARLYVPEWLLKLVPFWHIRMTLVLVRRASQLRKRCRYTVLEKWLPRLRNKAVFLVAGDADSYVAPGIAHELRRRIGSDCADVWVVPGAKHNGARRKNPDEYDNRLVEFFAHLSPHAQPVAEANRAQ